MSRLLLATALAALLAGCDTFRFPGVHRVTVQQGNVVTQPMIDRLKPGMTKSQVRFIMGSPVLSDPLDRNRWDYVYTFHLLGEPLLRRQISLYFLDEKLSYFEGHYLPTEEGEALAAEGPGPAAGATDAMEAASAAAIEAAVGEAAEQEEGGGLGPAPRPGAEGLPRPDGTGQPRPGPQPR